jgi:HPt (histidine-containing phosphotransfer) domain-containing protein
VHWGRSSTAVNGADAVRHVDEAVLARLVDDLGPDHVVELCEIFLADARERIQAVHTAARSAHRLKSAAGFVGFGGVSALCREIEDLASHGRLDHVAACARRMSEELDHASRELATLLEHLSRPR